VSELPEGPRKGKASRRPERTCVGCGRTDAADALVRLIVSPQGEVAFDLAGGQFGRGAYLHPSPTCIAASPRGLSKSFRQRIGISAVELASALRAAAERRAFGLIGSAVRSGKVDVGGEAVAKALEADRLEIVVVARDAAAAAALGPIMTAVREGRAVAVGTKAELGALVGSSDVAVLGLRTRGLAAELKKTVMLGTSAQVAED
jgi:predicted RNA-binding protein YlxR (DUF448 family)